MKFEVVVSKTVEVEFDETKFDDEFWSHFNSNIIDTGGEDFDYLAEYVSWNFLQGDEGFIEGIGDLKEMGVKVRMIDSDVWVGKMGS